MILCCTKRMNSEFQYYPNFQDMELSSNISPQQMFLKNFQTLKDLLIEDNYLNIKNLNISNHNLDEIFSYIKGIIRKFQIINQRSQSRIGQLEEALRKIDPSNITLGGQPQKEDESFGSAGYKLSNFVRLTPNTPHNFISRFTMPTINDHKKNARLSYKDKRIQKAKSQALQIKMFVWKQLQKSLVQDSIKKSSVPKDFLLNLYLRWNQINKRELQISKKSLLQQMLTNQIKILYPSVKESEKDYEGLTFRQDLIEALDSEALKKTYKYCARFVQDDQIGQGQQQLLSNISLDNMNIL